MLEEIWKPISNYEGYYSVSNLGRVRGERRIVRGQPGVFKYLKERILTPSPNDDGYLCVSLSKEHRMKLGKIHKLVAEAFVPIPDDLIGVENLTVNHKDLIKSNNHYGNLEWMTNIDNLRHAWDNAANSVSRMKFVTIKDNVSFVHSNLREFSELSGIPYDKLRNQFRNHNSFELEGFSIARL